MPRILEFVIIVSLTASASARELCETRSIMTLPWTICLADSSKEKLEMKSAIEKGMAELERIDGWMSEWKPHSLVTEINVNAGIKPVRLTDEAYECIRLSLEHSRLTGGAFDITFNAFFGKYSWKKGKERFPTHAEIKELLPLVDYRLVELDPKTKTVFLKKKGMKVGLGGMGEGWAVDKVVALLKAEKFEAGYVDASGAVAVWGRKPGGKLWTIGIGNPRAMSGEKVEQEIFKMYATDVAVTTSGDTQRSFRKNGKLFHHIIDPKTGHSAQNSIQVTAICKTATLCDLVDNGVFILGPKKGAEYARKQGVEVVIVDPAKKIHITAGLREVDTPWGPSLQFNTGIPGY